MVQDQIKIHIGGKVETTQGDEKQAENLVQKDLLQKNKDKGDKARSAQDERMIAQGLVDYIIKEVRLRQKDKAIKSHSQMPTKPGLYWAKYSKEVNNATRLIINIIGAPPMLYIKWIFSTGRLDYMADATVHKDGFPDPSEIDWGSEIEIPTIQYMEI